MKKFKPAIIAVGYNRPDCMRRLLTSIVNAEYDDNDIPLIISIDESDRSDEVQRVAEDVEWTHGEKIIRRFPQRQGLRQHILQCGNLSAKYGSVIVLEDDLFVSPAFYDYVCRAQEFYADTPEVACVALYSSKRSQFIGYQFLAERNGYDTYFGQYVITWGQSWSCEQWRRFRAWGDGNGWQIPDVEDRMPGEILTWTRAWSKFFVSYIVQNSLFYAVPFDALTTNFSEIGEHKSDTECDTAFQVPILAHRRQMRFAPFQEGVKYDGFYERIFDDSERIAGIAGNDICVDLYGTRVSCLGKKYLLTCKEYDLPLIRTYATRMRPMEVNVTYGIEGRGINLYRIDRDIELIPRKKKKNYKYQHNSFRIKYETYDIDLRKLLPYLWLLIREMINRKANKLLRKLRK